MEDWDCFLLASEDWGFAVVLVVVEDGLSAVLVVLELAELEGSGDVGVVGGGMLESGPEEMVLNVEEEEEEEDSGRQPEGEGIVLDGEVSVTASTFASVEFEHPGSSDTIRSARSPMNAFRSAKGS